MKNNKFIILLIGIGLIGWSIYHQKEINNPPPQPKPVVVPTPVVVPDLKEHIINDDYPKAINLTTIYHKELLIIFGADWCPYCKSLKKDLNGLNGLKKYLVCIINTDKDKYGLVEKFNIKGLPTSIIIDDKERELARKTGYTKQAYESWLNDIYGAKYTSWLN